MRYQQTIRVSKSSRGPPSADFVTLLANYIHEEQKLNIIRANRLSSHHGEVCKLFCSHTSRELDFFDEKGTRSGEQLLNMIDMCKAFSVDDECFVICSLFQVDAKN
jgi:hypothetical protein